MRHLTRRDFLRTSLAGTALAGAGGVTAWGQRRSHSDWVALGNSGVKVTRLAFGTGTFNGQVQRDLGQEASPGWCATRTTAAFGRSIPRNPTTEWRRCWARR